MGCVNCSIQLLSKQVNCSIDAKDLIDVYLQLLNNDVAIDNEIKNNTITLDNSKINSSSIATIPLDIIEIVNKSLGNLKIDNRYIDTTNKTVLISNKLLDKLTAQFKYYVFNISNIYLCHTSISNTTVRSVNFINTVLDKLSIRHSMLCNIANDYILLISEDEELIIDESGNFYIEIS